MIELYLLVWTVCSSTGFCVDNSTLTKTKYENPEIYLNQFVAFGNRRVVKNISQYQVKFYYCEFYGHKFEELNPCTEEKRFLVTTYSPCNYRECIYCKRTQVKKESWEWRIK